MRTRQPVLPLLVSRPIVALKDLGFSAISVAHGDVAHVHTITVQLEGRTSTVLLVWGRPGTLPWRFLHGSAASNSEYRSRPVERFRRRKDTEMGITLRSVADVLRFAVEDAQ